jgi:predicted RND superfamily exporter protein
MTVIEIVHTHPFAAGIVVGIVLAFCSFTLCTAFLYSLEKSKALAHENTKAEDAMARLGDRSRQMFSETSVRSPDSGSLG